MFKNNPKVSTKLTDKVTLAIMIVALLALIGLVFSFGRPLKLLDIKVPVATDKDAYYAGEKVSGIFFGEVFHNGSVKVLREIYCADYKAIIKTDEGDELFTGTNRPTKLDGTSRYIGRLPNDVPVNKNCVIQFINIYDINTPFGTRHEEVKYYTQNFTIKEKPSDAPENDSQEPTILNNNSASPNSNSTEDRSTPPLTPSNNSTTNNTTNNNTENNSVLPPVKVPECRINILFIHADCN